ncbi:MAG TPA: YceI family protein [Puia sp.]|nr:YceI family protein [Puia sp.]
MKKIVSFALLIAGMSACKKTDQALSTYEVNSTTSKIAWLGSAIDHHHIGAFALSGNVTTSGTTVTGGDFTVPISSIVDYDLQDPLKQQLLNDLKSANFFNIAVYPESKFHITKVAPYTGPDSIAVLGANYLVTGDFTMIGETHQLSFPAKISITGDSLTTVATFNLDRTQWGMTIYNDSTQRNYIYPTVEIDLEIQAGKTK